jgi:hypothetical protein
MEYKTDRDKKEKSKETLDFSAHFFFFLPRILEINPIPAEASAIKPNIFFRLRIIPSIKSPHF